MPARRWIIGITVFYLLLLAAVMVQYRYDERAWLKAKDGQLDLTAWDWERDGVAKIAGEWLFYPNRLMTDPASIPPGTQAVKAEVPGKWPEPYIGYGTYRVRLVIPPQRTGENGSLAYFLQSVIASHQLSVNGQLIDSVGRPAAGKDEYKAAAYPHISYAHSHAGVLDILIPVANFDNRVKAGMYSPLMIGLPDSVTTDHLFSLVVEFISGLIYLVLAFIFLLYVYFNRKKRDGWLYFSLFFFCAAVHSAQHGSRWIYRLFPQLSYEDNLRLILLSMLGVVLFVSLFLAKRYRIRNLQIANRVMLPLLVSLFLFCSITPADLFSWLFIPILVLIGGSLVFLIALLAIQVWQGREEALYDYVILLGTLIIGASRFLYLSGMFGVHEPNRAWSVLLLLFGFSLILIVAHRILLHARRSEAMSLELKRLNRSKDEFLQHAAYQLHAPLQAMTTLTATILSQVRRPEDAFKQLKLLEAIGRQMDLQLHELTDWSRLQEGTLELHAKPVELGALVRRVIEWKEYLMPGLYELQIIDRIGNHPVYVQADEDRLLQVVFNLLSAAIAQTEYGDLIVESSSFGSKVELALRGFARYDFGGAQDRRQALDVNLAVSRKLIELHGGTLLLGIHPAGSINIRMTLPTADAAPESCRSPEMPPLRDNEPPAVPAAGSAFQEIAFSREMTDIRILVLDDDPVNLEIIRNLLLIDGIATDSVSSAKDIDALLDSVRKYDLVILDAGLPGISGIEICRRIRRVYPLFDLPVLMTTSSIRPGEVIAALAAGANDTLAVPIASTELRARVRNLLRIKASAADFIRMEMAFLQAQIKPHFLFNTLNSIAALSEEDPAGLRRLLDSFATYLRESFRFDSMEPLIPLDRELGLVRSYLEIEKIRFGDRLSIEMDIDDGVQKALIPPLTIQPLVENAVRHGLMTRKRGGLLKVAVKAEDPFCSIAVIDDGVGMEMPGNPLQAPNGSKQGVGMQNVERRLRQVYGTGLTVTSNPDLGSTVSFRIPLTGGHQDENHPYR
ncbi:response regulator [Cohnella sp. CFH 77786]|uniref:hybrid sensor histidine kinase/response regulator n=1 Tax=Cohnella sp. CFH 77786 TaxID=2662265 RepID=UPI001C60B8D2|nr:response regulator [Cohnella sp. CFH 77786]